jgi:hypothetical protein
MTFSWIYSTEWDDGLRYGHRALATPKPILLLLLNDDSAILPSGKTQIPETNGESSDTTNYFRRKKNCHDYLRACRCPSRTTHVDSSNPKVGADY